MNILIVPLAVACVFLSCATSTAGAAAKRPVAHRAGPAVIVVADPSGYAEPQVYVRRYEGVIFEYVAPRLHRARRYAVCVYPKRMTRSCKGYKG
jgi:hypothetical protein